MVADIVIVLVLRKGTGVRKEDKYRREAQVGYRGQ